MVDKELFATFEIEPVAMITIPGLTPHDLAQMHVASNTHANIIAAIGNRRYANKEVSVEAGSFKYRNRIGNPSEIMRGCVDIMTSKLIKGLMTIDEATIKKDQIEAIDVPPADIAVELNGKSVFPIHKMIEEIAPKSFNENMTRENFDKVSGAELTRSFQAQGFVKPNDVLGKIKPRLIQHFTPQGSASSALMNKTIEEMLFRLPYFVKRSIKGTDNTGVASRIHGHYKKFKKGGVANNDYGNFDSSITDKCTGNTDIPGLRKIIEKGIMDEIAKRFPEATDLKNTPKFRWKKVEKVACPLEIPWTFKL